MTEVRRPYGRSAHPIRPETLRPFADDWQQPTPDEVRAVLAICGLTGSAASRLVGIADSRTVRRWTGGETPIPYSVWAILCHVAGFGAIWK